MKKTRLILTMLYWEAIIICVAIAACYESGLAEKVEPANDAVEFWVVTIMEILTLAGIPLALRLFKFRSVEQELMTAHLQALQKWGVVRLSVLEMLMIGNTLLYYFIGCVPFGYLAIITAVAMVFVYPSKERCDSESFTEGAE